MNSEVLYLKILFQIHQNKISSRTMGQTYLIKNPLWLARRWIITKRKRTTKGHSFCGYVKSPIHRPRGSGQIASKAIQVFVSINEAKRLLEYFFIATFSEQLRPLMKPGHGRISDTRTKFHCWEKHILQCRLDAKKPVSTSNRYTNPGSRFHNSRKD